MRNVSVLRMLLWMFNGILQYTEEFRNEDRVNAEFWNQVRRDVQVIKNRISDKFDYQ